MTAPDLYVYASGTGEWLGRTRADPDPEHVGGWLIPAFTTDRAPPPVPPGQAAVFVSGAWTLAADHRGETWYTADGLSVVVARLGDPATFDPPLGPTAPTAAPSPVPASVPIYQFAGQAYAEGLIDLAAAKAWAGAGTVPQVLLDAVDAHVTDRERHDRVVLFLMGAREIPRFHELTPILGATFSKDTPGKLDAFFVAASQR